jgi:DNA-binding NarL/FixJ family response regulator
LDQLLWNQIKKTLGESSKLKRFLLVEGRTPYPPVLVVVVEHRALPGDEELRRRFQLTPRESQVARLLTERWSNREIAHRLGISVHTVRRHVERVLAKLAIHHRNQVRIVLQDSGLPAKPQPARSVA